MKTRPLRAADVPLLRDMYAQQGFEYTFPDLAHSEAVLVLVDDQDKPMAAVVAERLVQLYFLQAPYELPHVALHGLRILHRDMAALLRGIGYDGVEAFIPPSIASKFGRRLERTFGWVKNWPSWSRRI